ncbi:helix-turn-helix transcriptional regulator [Telmatospirillum sp.]|uniref:LexA family transcriptional regulator n=1 Tax=Telmatospirillum sp. TaxID=2079197 RepID=UPI002849DE4A|nr:helix-turn-helix transcriptional regulator [Telmatospirillum sp.]MDR3440753.1 helix-turn-helix transcriptional regulator [Telmatospirillum sp.]
MLTHTDIWAAIDRLAQENRLTASGLARRAGLDPTTFNRSKRITKEGKTRWPSTESLAKILEATETSFSHFVGLVRPDTGETAPDTVPLTNLNDATAEQRFNAEGFPVGTDWDEIALPRVADPHAFAVEVTDNRMEPVYQDGDILIVSPSMPPRRGDRVLVRTTGGEVLIKRLLRHTAKRIELQSLAVAGKDLSLPIDEVASLARIVWASQ